jgi:hypothetical protein
MIVLYAKARLTFRNWRHWRHKFYSKWKFWLEALRQVAVVLAISNLVPLLVIFLIHVLTEAHAPFTFSEFVTVAANNIKPSDVFVYVCAIIAPVLFTMYTWHRAGTYFPYFWSFISVQALIELVGVIIFGLDRLNKISNWAFVHNAAIALYLIALLVWYFSLVFDNKKQSEIGSNQPTTGAQGLIDGLSSRGE